MTSGFLNGVLGFGWYQRLWSHVYSSGQTNEGSGKETQSISSSLHTTAVLSTPGRYSRAPRLGYISRQIPPWLPQVFFCYVFLKSPLHFSFHHHCLVHLDATWRQATFQRYPYLLGAGIAGFGHGYCRGSWAKLFRITPGDSAGCDLALCAYRRQADKGRAAGQNIWKGKGKDVSSGKGVVATRCACEIVGEF